MDRDTASWPDWYLAGALHCIARVIAQGVSDDQIVRTWHAYVDGAAKDPSRGKRVPDRA